MNSATKKECKEAESPKHSKKSSEMPGRRCPQSKADREEWQNESMGSSKQGRNCFEIGMGHKQ